MKNPQLSSYHFISTPSNIGMTTYMDFSRQPRKRELDGGAKRGEANAKGKKNDD